MKKSMPMSFVQPYKCFQLCFFLFTSCGVNTVKAQSRDINKPVAVLMPLDAQRVHEIASLLPINPSGFGSNYHNRSIWNKLYKNSKYKAVIQDAETLLNKPFPAWSDSLYLVFFTKGTRPEGEQMIRARASWLPILVWAECLENKGRFIPALETTLKELIHQKSWVLPAHDRKHQNFDGKTYTVDLTSSRLSHSLAQAAYLLCLPEVKIALGSLSNDKLYFVH